MCWSQLLFTSLNRIMKLLKLYRTKAAVHAFWTKPKQYLLDWLIRRQSLESALCVLIFVMNVIITGVDFSGGPRTHGCWFSWMTLSNGKPNTVSIKSHPVYSNLGYQLLGIYISFIYLYISHLGYNYPVKCGFSFYK